MMNEECHAYFRQKDIHEQAHDDIVDAFRKVIRQRLVILYSKIVSSLN